MSKISQGRLFKKIFSGLIWVLLFSKIDAETYFEAYSGAMFGSLHLNQVKTEDTYHIEGLKGNFSYFVTKAIEPNFIGGVKIGAWFCKKDALESFVGQYFGCYLDASYDSFYFHKHLPNTLVNYKERGNTSRGIANTHFSLKGYDVSAALMLAARCGLWKGEKNAFGVIQPYFAVGPALLIARQKPRLKIGPHQADDTDFSVVVSSEQKIVGERKVVVAPALALDVGVRWMVAESVFLETFFKYRYAKLYFRLHHKMNFHPSYSLCSCHLGLGYYF
jgi:hypothetical protein